MICSSPIRSRSFNSFETKYVTKESFIYDVCVYCGVCELRDKCVDFGKCYSKSYHSLSTASNPSNLFNLGSLKKLLRKKVNDLVSINKNILRFTLKYWQLPWWLTLIDINSKSHVLFIVVAVGRIQCCWRNLVSLS